MIFTMIETIEIMLENFDWEGVWKSENYVH
jgi:hypothetical protein